MKKSRKSRKDKEKDRNDIEGNRSDNQKRKSLINKLLGDGGHRFNRLMNKLSEADDEGYGYIDEETFLDTIFIHLRTRHRPSVEESQWLVEQLHVKNKRMNLIAYKELRSLITGDHINLSPKKNIVRKYTIPSFIDQTNYPYPYPSMINSNPLTYNVSNYSQSLDLGPAAMRGAMNDFSPTSSSVYHAYPYQSIMNRSKPMNKWRDVEISDDEDEEEVGEKEIGTIKQQQSDPRLKSNQNIRWATRAGSVGEWLEYQATPLERMNLEELLELIENYIIDKGLNSGNADCPAGVGRPTEDGISLKIGPSLQVKLSFHTSS